MTKTDAEKKDIVKLCSIKADTLMRFLHKTTGKSLPNIVLRMNSEGFWVKQSCELAHRYIWGLLSATKAEEWNVTDEVVLAIGGIEKFKSVIKMFSGVVSLSLDGYDLVVSDGKKTFQYILFAIEAVKGGVHDLETNPDFMAEENVQCATLLPIDFLESISKGFPLTEASTIKFTFSPTDVQVKIRDKHTHGLTMNHEGEITGFPVGKKILEIKHNGSELKEAIDRLSTDTVQYVITKNKRGLLLSGIVETGEGWMFVNYFTPMIDDEVSEVKDDA